MARSTVEASKASMKTRARTTTRTKRRLLARSKHHGAGRVAARRRGGQARAVESVGSEDALEELPQRNRRRRRIYKIQEASKRGQIITRQVVKEERGNKGAALTTYLCLAALHGADARTRQRRRHLAEISSPGDPAASRNANELDVPEGMGLTSARPARRAQDG